MSDTALTREELFYQAILNGQIPDIVPITRQEKYLAKIAAKIAAGGGTGTGGGVSSVGGIYPDLSGNVALKKLTFTGAVEGSYDGSEALSVEIPPKTYIGENGNWWIGDEDTGVSAGGSGGGGDWTMIKEVDLTDTTILHFDELANYNEIVFSFLNVRTTNVTNPIWFAAGNTTSVPDNKRLVMAKNIFILTTASVNENSMVFLEFASSGKLMKNYVRECGFNGLKNILSYAPPTNIPIAERKPGEGITIIIETPAPTQGTLTIYAK